MPTECRSQCAGRIAEGQEPLHSAVYCHQLPRALKENHRENPAGRDLWKSLAQASAQSRARSKTWSNCSGPFSTNVWKSPETAQLLWVILSRVWTRSLWKQISFYLVGVSLGALCGCCFPPFLYAPRRVWEGVYSENLDPVRSLKPSTVLVHRGILFPRPTESQCLQLFHVGPSSRSLISTLLQLLICQHFFFFAQEGECKTGKKLEMIPEEALSAERRGAITSPICQLCSAKSCKSYSAPQQAFSVTRTHCWLTFLPLRTCQSFSAEMPPGQNSSQNGNPIQCARLPLSLPSHNPCWPVLPDCLRPSEWQPCPPCRAPTVSPSLMSHVNALGGHSAPPPRSLMMLDRAAPASSPEADCLAQAVSWTLILQAWRSSQLSTNFLVHPLGPQFPVWLQLCYVKSISLCSGWENSECTSQSCTPATHQSPERNGNNQHLCHQLRIPPSPLYYYNNLLLLSIFFLLYSQKGYQQGLLTPHSAVINKSALLQRTEAAKMWSVSSI